MSSADWYTPGGTPSTGSSGSSAAMRGELALIETATDKLPPLTGQGSEIVQVNAGGTALTSITIAVLAGLIGASGFAIDDAVNNDVTNILDLIHTTSGSPTAGIGTGLTFSTEADDGTFTGMVLESVSTGVGTGAEAFDFVVKLAAGGAAASEKFRVDSAGVLTLQSALAVTQGGTGATSASGARSNLGLVIGTNVQAFGDVLDDLNTLGAATADNEFLVATGAGVLAWEAGATARTSMGLGTSAVKNTGITSGLVPLVGTKSSTTTLAGLVERSTSAENVAGTDDTVTPTVAGVKEMIDTHVSAGLTLATPVATTSGTTITFTGIPAGTKQIILMLHGVSTSGTSILLARLGDSGGVEATGYEAGAVNLKTGVVKADSNIGFALEGAGESGSIRNGSYIFNLESTAVNNWTMTGGSYDNSSETVKAASGSKPLSAELTQIQIIATNGTDTFDAGEVNIAYQ